MKLFLDLSYLFCVGSVLGYLIEVLFRRFFSAKRWTNPGYLYGPFLPIYGFGLLLMFIFSSFEVSTGISWLNSLLSICFIACGMIGVEYLAGLIFIKGMHIKLWDYSNMRGNIQGIICPLFNIIWFALGAAYYFLLHKYVVLALDWFEGHVYYAEYWLGFAYGLLCFDLIASSNAVGKITKAARSSNVVISYESYKLAKAQSKKDKKTEFIDEYPTLKEFVAKTKEKSSELIGRMFFTDQYRAYIKEHPTKEVKKGPLIDRNPLVSKKEYEKEVLASENKEMPDSGEKQK